MRSAAEGRMCRNRYRSSSMTEASYFLLLLCVTVQNILDTILLRTDYCRDSVVWLNEERGKEICIVGFLCGEFAYDYPRSTRHCVTPLTVLLLILGINNVCTLTLSSQNRHTPAHAASLSIRSIWVSKRVRVWITKKREMNAPMPHHRFLPCDAFGRVPPIREGASKEVQT